MKTTWWCAQWPATWNKLDGYHRPRLMSPFFETKAQCQRYIKERYGYIAKRPDLRKEPHCWRMPKPVRVTVTVSEKRNG